MKEYDEYLHIFCMCVNLIIRHLRQNLTSKLNISFKQKIIVIAKEIVCEQMRNLSIYPSNFNWRQFRLGSNAL